MHFAVLRVVAAVNRQIFAVQHAVFMVEFHRKERIFSVFAVVRLTVVIIIKPLPLSP